MLAAQLTAIQPTRLPLLYREIQYWQDRLQLAVGDLSGVERWWANLPQHDAALPPAHQEQEELLVARWLLAQGKAQEALIMLERLLAAAQGDGRIRSALEIQMLMALAYAVGKQEHEAQQQLRMVLVQARSENYLRLFLDEGEPMAMLLHNLFANLREKSLLSYLQTIVRAFVQEEHAGQLATTDLIPASLIEPLSPQEQRVLHLLATGLSNPEIARELVVSVNTIRTQVQSIYRKLGVSNRVAASEAARSLQLLS
jgi:LuxR family maltose regulon positive regulatory protein